MLYCFLNDYSIQFTNISILIIGIIFHSIIQLRVHMEILQNMIIEGPIVANQPQQYLLKKYINAKQQLQHVPIVICFLIIILLASIIVPVSIFLSNYDLIGVSINPKGNIATGNQVYPCQLLQKFVSEDFQSCTSNCSQGAPYLQKYCISDINLNNTIFQSAQLHQQISIHNLKTSFYTIIYSTAILLIITLLSACILIAIPLLFHCYVFIGFSAILGLGFYLLKNQQLRQNSYPQYIFQGSIYYEDEIKMRYFGYILFVVYLLTFPIILFSYNKIQKAVQILALLKVYYCEMIGVQLISFGLPIAIWGLCMFQIFIIMQIYSSGDKSIQQNSFLYVFTGTSSIISNPAFLIIHFIRIFWLYTTLLTWHQHLLNASVNMWYFSQNQKEKPLKRALKKSRKRFGAACISALLMLPQWLILILSCIFHKTNPKDNVQLLKIPQQKISPQKINRNINRQQSIISRNLEIQKQKSIKNPHFQTDLHKNQYTQQNLFLNNIKNENTIEDLNFLKTDQKAAKNEGKQKIQLQNQPRSNQKLLQLAFLQSPNKQILNQKEQRLKYQVNKDTAMSLQTLKFTNPIQQHHLPLAYQTPNGLISPQQAIPFQKQLPLMRQPVQSNSIQLANQIIFAKQNNQQVPVKQIDHCSYPQNFAQANNQRSAILNQRNNLQRKACHIQLYDKLCNWIGAFNCNVNRLHSVTGLYPNLSYFQACQKAAQSFETKNGSLSYIGTIIKVLLTFIYCSLWILLSYILLNSGIYSTEFPPTISSLTVPILAVFITCLIVTTFITNIIVIPVDSILFDFLIDHSFSTLDRQKRLLGKNNITQALQVFIFN